MASSPGDAFGDFSSGGASATPSQPGMGGMEMGGGGFDHFGSPVPQQQGAPPAPMPFIQTRPPEPADTAAAGGVTGIEAPAAKPDVPGFSAFDSIVITPPATAAKPPNPSNPHSQARAKGSLVFFPKVSRGRDIPDNSNNSSSRCLPRDTPASRASRCHPRLRGILDSRKCLQDNTRASRCRPRLRGIQDSRKCLQDNTRASRCRPRLRGILDSRRCLLRATRPRAMGNRSTWPADAPSRVPCSRLSRPATDAANGWPRRSYSPARSAQGA